jgi:hypothetical protein
MKTMLAALAILLVPTTLCAQQQPPEWLRVYTFDESVIDIKTSEVVTLFGERGRVTFRWSFDRPEALAVGSRIKYKSRLEVIEFDCVEHRYRPYEITFFDSSGKVRALEAKSPDGPWNDVARGSMTERLYDSACRLITPHREIFRPVSDEEAEEAREEVAAEKVERFARSFWHNLEEKKDFGPLVKEFFAPDYLSGYLQDKETNWFLTLDPAVAARVSPAELQRYHVALMNLAYLSAAYFVGQSPSEDETVPDEKLVAPGVADLVLHHPYTSAHRGAKGGYDYLEEKIDSAERLRGYTELLESTAALFRRNLKKAEAGKRKDYRAPVEDLLEDSVRARSWVCSRECFNLPNGTKLFQVSVPVFRLQIAELDGELKIISVMPNFQ